MNEVESHEETMDKVEQLGSQFLGCAKVRSKQHVCLSKVNACSHYIEAIRLISLQYI